jgi:hypothetical protein
MKEIFPLIAMALGYVTLAYVFIPKTDKNK